MKSIDNMPIMVVIAALLINIAIGVNNNISFSALMIRCIIVTIIFGVFGYMVTETVKNALECSRLSKPAQDTADELAGMEEIINGSENKPMLDIKVPPLDDEEFINMDNDSDTGFVEVSPVLMGKYRENGQD